MSACSACGAQLPQPVVDPLVSLRAPAFMTPTAIAGFVAMLAPAVFGWYTSMAGRGAAWLDE